MVRKVIEIVVDENGKIESESHGIKGEECIEVLQNLIGGIADIEEFTPKRDYYDEPPKARLTKKRNVKRKQHLGSD